MTPHVLRDRPAQPQAEPQRAVIPVEPDSVLGARERAAVTAAAPARKPAPALSVPPWREGLTTRPWLHEESAYNDCAVCWVAGGRNYAEDAHAPSAESVAREMSGVQRVLFTDESTAGLPNFTKAHQGPRRHHPDLWYLDSVKYYNYALTRFPLDARLMFLDTDTYCCAPMYDVFDLLDRFDLVGTHGITRHTTGTAAPIPDSFPELCIGMLAVRNNARVQALFKLWLELYEGHVDAYGNNDQGPLREAVWQSPDVRIYIVTPEYHCRAGFGAYVAGRVRLVHSRARLVEMAHEINATGGMRLYRPGGIIWRPGQG